MATTATQMGTNQGPALFSFGFRPFILLGMIRAISALALIAVLAPIGAGFGISHDPRLHLAGGAWVLAFAGFAVIYAPMLTRERPATAAAAPA